MRKTKDKNYSFIIKGVIKAENIDQARSMIPDHMHSSGLMQCFYVAEVKEDA